MEDIFRQVEKNIDNLVENNVDWAACATGEMLDEARSGKINLRLGVNRRVPGEWFRGGVKDKSILCLAGAGGLQAPILAAAGARVTVLDISDKMLKKDRAAASEYGLDIQALHGNMCDLSRFSGDTFDYIVNPVSLVYVPDVTPVFRECYRTLKKGGSLIMASINPIAYVCEHVDDGNGGYYKAVNKMPYKSTEHDGQKDWVEFGHTMESYIRGQIDCGFVISGYIEDQTDDITELYFMTKADKI